MATQKLVCIVLGLGVFPAAVVAWYHGEKGRQQVCKLEVAILTALTIAGLFAIRALYLGPLA